jgi:hypothetical protein
MYVFLYQEYLDNWTPVKITFSLAPPDSHPTAETAVTMHHFSLA